MASNSPLSKPLLTVVDEIQNQNLADYQDLIYETDFWTPLIPIKTKSFEKVEPKKFCFEIDDEIVLDATGLLKRHFNATGSIEVTDLGNQDSKGKSWNVDISLQEPIAEVKIRIRARDIEKKKVLKVGIFIQTMKFDNKLLDGFGRDAILFALRIYIRKMIQTASKIN